MQPMPSPSLDLDPSKNNFQNKDLTTGLSTKFTHLEVFVSGKNSICETTKFSKKGEVCALKFSRYESTK